MAGVTTKTGLSDQTEILAPESEPLVAVVVVGENLRQKTGVPAEIRNHLTDEDFGKTEAKCSEGSTKPHGWCGTLRRCCGPPHWGFMVVLASFFANFFVVGFGYSCGLYYLEWLDYFDDSTSGVISSVGSINLGLLGLAGPIGAILTTRFGDRVVVIVSSIVASLGLVSSAFVDNIYLMVFTFGIVTGFGFSLTYSPMATVPMYFFDERRAGLALGIAMSGGGCGSFLMPVLIGKLVDAFGWRGSLLILGGLHLNCCICGALLRPRKTLPKTTERRPIVDVKILRNVSFVMFLLAQVLFAMSISVVYIHVASLVETLTNVTRDKSSVIISVIGIVNFLARIIHGAIAGINAVDIFSQYSISCIIAFAALFAFPNVPSYVASVTFAGIFGFCIAPYVTLSQPIMVTLVGLENLQISFGLFMFMSGIGLISGAPIAGLLYDLTGDYRMSMYFGGATMMGCVVFTIQPWVDASCRKKHLVEIHDVVDVDNI